MKLERINKVTAGEKVLPESFDGYFLFQESSSLLLDNGHFKKEYRNIPKGYITFEC